MDSSYDLWLVKTDPRGKKEWSRTYGGNDTDILVAMDRTSDGGYILVGWTNQEGSEGSRDFWVVKTDPRGKKEWSRTYGEDGSEIARSVVQTSDGGYVIVGGTVPESQGGTGGDFFLVKTDSQGNVEWSKTYGGSKEGGAGSIVRTDGGKGEVAYLADYGRGVKAGVVGGIVLGIVFGILTFTLSQIYHHPPQH